MLKKIVKGLCFIKKKVKNEMMFQCDDLTKIYVVCPAYAKTGGLELLHQLVYALNSNEIKTYITYVNDKGDNPVNAAFQKYITEYRTMEQIEDKKGNYVIISEHQLELMDSVKNADVIIWWLSVDNYLKVYHPKTAYRLLGVKGFLWYVKHRRWHYCISRINNRIPYNLAQSYYAISFLKKNNFRNIDYLSDYISTDYLNVNCGSVKQRKNVVLYNPKKGRKFSEYLMTLEPEIEWVPLINLSNEQVREHLLNSKVYVDFGNHPGKDRFPREAAVCGCCVITGKNGSARFSQDVTIPEKYKFEVSKENGKSIINCIKSCFQNYEEKSRDFDNYRSIINSEYEKFYQDVKRIFVKNC